MTSPSLPCRSALSGRLDTTGLAWHRPARLETSADTARDEGALPRRLG